MSYRYHIIILLTVYISIVSPVYAWTGDIIESEKIAKSLARIESIDHRMSQSQISQTRLEKNILTVRRSLVKSLEKIAPTTMNVWRHAPAYDITRSYIPYLQKYNLSCELAALSMLLGSIWVPTSEDAIYRDIPHDMSVYTGGVWWDPDREFVGYLTGSQRFLTGYGVHGAPLQTYLASRGYRSTLSSDLEYMSGMTSLTHLRDLIIAIENSKRVMLWWDYCTLWEYEDGIVSRYDTMLMQKFPISGKNNCARDIWDRRISWTTPLKKNIETINGEHAFVLLGYIGTRDTPTHIIVWDTATGRHIYETSEWLRKWSLMNNRSLTLERK
jgi:hypothetical protein